MTYAIYFLAFVAILDEIQGKTFLETVDLLLDRAVAVHHGMFWIFGGCVSIAIFVSLFIIITGKLRETTVIGSCLGCVGLITIALMLFQYTVMVRVLETAAASFGPGGPTDPPTFWFMMGIVAIFGTG